MAKFKVVTPSGAGFSVPGVGYKLEMEALAPIDAEIVEIAGKTDDDFVKEARDADALYAKSRRVTKRIIDGMERCKVISLGSVGVDSVDVDAATARFDPVRKRRVGQEIALVLGGRWPRSCVNPSVLEKSKLVRWQPYSMERGPGA